MLRFQWPLVLLICLLAALLTLGVKLPYFSNGGPLSPPGIAEGEQEIAWLHTAVNWTTWERFVSGVARARMLVPGLRVDDSRAFRDKTHEFPEIVLTVDGKPGVLRIRWYKISSEATTAQWVEALCQRPRPPLAIIGGSTTDRAAELAIALRANAHKSSVQPLLLITTASSNMLPADAEAEVEATGAIGRRLLDVYPNKTFRFCFSNSQMADSLLDFIWQRPDLRPQRFSKLAPLAVGSGLMAQGTIEKEWDPTLRFFAPVWHDDPFSEDLHNEFAVTLQRLVCGQGKPETEQKKKDSDENGCRIPLESFGLPYSVGGFNRPNREEARAAGIIHGWFEQLPPQRILVILPTVTQPARRMMKTLSETAIQFGHELIAINGDGIPVNSIYRDGEFAWPVQSLTQPLLLFTHHNPIAWDGPDNQAAPTGYELFPPSSTEDVLHFAEMTKIIVIAAFGLPGEEPGGMPEATQLISNPDELAERLRHLCPPFFDEQGNRLDGTGEYVVLLRPQQREPIPGEFPRPLAWLEVWRRGQDRWVHLRTIEINQWQTRQGPFVSELSN